jgi:hypothetical protein
VHRRVNQRSAGQPAHGQGYRGGAALVGGGGAHPYSEASIVQFARSRLPNPRNSSCARFQNPFTPFPATLRNPQHHPKHTRNP